MRRGYEHVLREFRIGDLDRRQHVGIARDDSMEVVRPRDRRPHEERN